MRRNDLACIAMASALAIGSLSGCSTYKSAVNYIAADSPLTCPDAAILAGTSSLPAFDPRKTADPSSLLYTIAMTNVTTRCDYNKRTFKADANMTITFRANRAPGGDDVRYRVPYYIAVTSNGEILDKQVRSIEFGFPKGVSNVTGEEEVHSFVVQADKAKKPYEYHLLVGFQLTKAQVDYNKQMGQFEP